MIYSDPRDLPTDHKPEHLIVISEETFGKAMQSYAQGEFLLDPNISYLLKPNNHETNAHPITKALLKQGHLKENTILLLDKDSWGERYLSYDMLTRKTIHFQMQSFVELCQLLGAKSVHCITNTQDKRNSSLDSELCMDIANTVVNGGLDTKYSKNNSQNSSLENNTNFSGGKVNLVEAERVMRTKIFDDNENIIAFYNSARCQENRMTYQKVKFQVAQEVGKQLELIAKIEAPLFNKTIGNAKFKKTSTELSSLCIEYEVTF